MTTMLSYCEYSCTPEIPYVEDILYKLGLLSKDRYYRFCECNCRTYCDNVDLVVEAIRQEYPNLTGLDKRKIAMIAVRLVPMKARCMFNSAFCELQRHLGHPAPRMGASREEMKAMCTCDSCNGVLSAEELAQQEEERMWSLMDDAESADCAW
jgi:hypothetical protein